MSMGNESSELARVDLDGEAIEVTDSWSLHCSTNGKLSVFVSHQRDDGPKNSKSRLQLFARNLMLHRHPCILKFYSTFTKANRYYLATEEVKPLPLLVANQTGLEVCIGLHNILKALVFLHNNAESAHNNVCCSSVYVTQEGVWKLGNLEFLKKFSDVTRNYLQETRGRRFEKAIPPEEDNLEIKKPINAAAIDVYSFGVLAEELLKKKTEEIPCLIEFRELCKKRLQASDPASRPSLSEVLAHPFFTHDFIRIHSFLMELPLKTNEEKQTFFSDLTEQLRQLPEDLIGSQLISLLLSRLVLLDPSAQQHLLPNILHPMRVDAYQNEGVFTDAAFKEYVIPKLLQIFCVRDAQIRLLLLSHFPVFCHMFSKEQLQVHILPELLVGIKDTNDQLVSVTLRSLSELVPILGSKTVIGGKRFKLFTDGRPSKYETRHRVKDTSSLTILVDDLPERPSPDGGEDNSSSTTVEEIEAESDVWSDWDVTTNAQCDNTNIIDEEESVPGSSSQVDVTNHKPQELPDITSLDIKNSKTPPRRSSTTNEFDFFQDMEPVISKPKVIHVDQVPINKFQVAESEDIGGWEEEDGEWGTTDD